MDTILHTSSVCGLLALFCVQLHCVPLGLTRSHTIRWLSSSLCFEDGRNGHRAGCRVDVDHHVTMLQRIILFWSRWILAWLWSSLPRSRPLSPTHLLAWLEFIEPPRLLTCQCFSGYCLYCAAWCVDRRDSFFPLFFFFFLCVCVCVLLDHKMTRHLENWKLNLLSNARLIKQHYLSSWYLT